MLQFIYPAVFLKTSDSYKVLIPDLDLTTDGDDISHAYLFAKDLLRVYFSYVTKYDLDYNLPSKFEDIQSRCGTNQHALLIDIIIPEEGESENLAENERAQNSTQESSEKTQNEEAFEEYEMFDDDIILEEDDYDDDDDDEIEQYEYSDDDDEDEED